ncbi:alpha/beta hydrolase [Candidatus Amarolinea dominans]|uniref:alpha/beta fold hydrolase n=1 Tax=Candidatus Amarolinea dominans TaxID=3140696 RepID=UPI00313656A9|nr:alpha/beta hydrolase [Anaerolineae bacterium]MBK9094367.1 alpha/beta hydrolase [Anaerolineae bacterium]
MPTIAVNNVRLRYETWGDGPPLVMLHGLGSCADDWVYQLPDLGRHFRCLPLDLRGHGLSDKPPGPYSMAQFAADVSGLLHTLDIGPAHVLGLSLGGMVAQQLALARPDLVRSLVLINTMPGPWPPTRDVLRTATRRLRALRGPAADMSATATLIARTLFPQEDQRLLHTYTVQRMAANDPHAYRHSLRAITRFWPGRALRRITCPVLILAGTLDTVVPMVYKERLRRLLPQASFVTIANSRHASNLDQPDVVNQAILNFLLPLKDQHVNRK